MWQMKRKQRQKRLQQEVVFPVRKEIKGTRGQQVRLGRRVIRESAVTPALSGQPANGDRQVMLVRQARRGRKATGESGERPV